MARCELASTYAATRAAIALHAYSTRHGVLPARLRELVPAYLAAVPRDAFDGAELRYDPRARRLWSIGDDFEDDGGETNADARRSELAWEIPLRSGDEGPSG